MVLFRFLLLIFISLYNSINLCVFKFINRKNTLEIGFYLSQGFSK